MSRLVLTLLVLGGSVLSGWSAAPPLSLLPADLPAGARLRIGTSHFRHGGIIRAVAFSPNEQWLASASHDHTASVWDVSTGRELFRFLGHGSDVLCVAFSADGKELATGGADGTVRLWSLSGARAGQELHTFTSKAEAIEALAFSPGGRILAAGGDDGVLRLYDPARHTLIRQMSQDRAVRCLAWSADGKRIASNAAKRAVALWDVGRGTLLRAFGDDSINCLTFAPGRQLLTWESGGTLRLWDFDKGTQVRAWSTSEENSGGEALIYQIAYSHDGRSVFCGSTTGPIDVHDPATGKRRKQLIGHQGRVPALAVSPRGKLLATGGADGTIRLWNPSTGKAIRTTPEPSAPIVSLSLAPKGRQLAVVLGTGQVQLWDRSTGKQLPARFKGTALTAVFGPDGLLNLVGGDGRLARWNPQTGKVSMRKDAGPGATTLALTPDGKVMVTTHRDGTLQVRDGEGKPLRQCQGKERRVTAVISPDGSITTVVGAMATVPLWSSKTGRPQTPLPGHSGGVLAASFSPDGKIFASGGRDRLVQLWDLRTYKEIRSPLGHTAWVCAIAFSPDNKLIASATVEGDISVWSAKTGRLLAELEGHRGPVAGLAFSEEKSLLSAGRDASVLVWDVTAASEGRAPLTALTAEKRERFWGYLLVDEPALASVAIQKLASDPAAVVPQLRARLRPVDGKKIAKFLKDLDNEEFKTRKAAFDGLKAMGRFAEQSLRKDLLKKPALEKHRRLEVLLSALADEKTTSEHRRALRAVEVLALIGTADARKVLQTLADGAPEAELTRKAKLALEKLKP